MTTRSSGSDKAAALKHLKPPADWPSEQKRAWKEAFRFINLSPEEQAAELKAEGEDIVERSILYAKLIDGFASSIAIRADYIDEHELGAAYADLADQCDYALAKLKESGVNLWPDKRAARTRTRDLTIEATSAMRKTRDFIRALEQDIALSEAPEDEMREMLSDYAYHLRDARFGRICLSRVDGRRRAGRRQDARST